MNGLKYAVLSLAVLACFDGSAKRKNKKAKKAETVRVDTCSVDTFSYAMGMANTQGLKNYVTSRIGSRTQKVAGIQCRIADSSASRGTSHPGHRQTDSRERLREDPQPQPLFGGIRQDAGRPTYGYELAKSGGSGPKANEVLP